MGPFKTPLQPPPTTPLFWPFPWHWPAIAATAAGETIQSNFCSSKFAFWPQCKCCVHTSAYCILLYYIVGTPISGPAPFRRPPFCGWS